MGLPGFLIDGVEIEKCVVQGGMAREISTSELACAVAREGGIGVIGGAGMNAFELRSEIKAAKVISEGYTGFFGVNLMAALGNFWELYEVCKEEGVRFLFVGAGLPTREMFERAGKMIVVPIISRAAILKVMVKRLGVSPKAVVVESGKAGGHLGTKDTETTIWEILPEVVAMRDSLDLDCTVIVAGGILHGEDIVRALSLGASAVQMGTRFAMTEESNACDALKELWRLADKTVVIKSPVGLDGRVVPTEFLNRVGEKTRVDISKCKTHCLETCSGVYCIFGALGIAQKIGDPKRSVAFAGARVTEIDDIVSVSMVFSRLEEEFEGG